MARTAFDRLRRLRQLAQAGDAIPIPAGAGFLLNPLPHGAHRYPVVLDCHEFRAHLTDSASLPTVWVQLRSSFIHEVGPQSAVVQSASAVADVLGERISAPHASRIDVYADVGGWILTQADRPGFVTNAHLRAHFRAGSEELDTIQAGKSPFLVRAYRKDRELVVRSAPRPVLWGGWDGAVTRVEAQVGSARLRDFHIGSVDEALASLGDLWRHATSEFVELRTAGPGPRESWPVTGEWRTIQALAFGRFPRSGVVPFRIVEGDRLRLLRALFGYLTSLGAVEDESRLRSLLRVLPVLLGTVTRGRSFDLEVERKRARLPRAVRESRVDSEAASASPGKRHLGLPNLHKRIRGPTRETARLPTRRRRFVVPG